MLVKKIITSSLLDLLGLLVAAPVAAVLIYLNAPTWGWVGFSMIVANNWAAQADLRNFIEDRI